METVVINTEALRMTEEDFFKFCIQNRDLQIERDSNQNIFIMSPTGGITGKYNSFFTAKVWLWNEKKKSGYVFDSSTGFTLPNKAVRSPDVAWIEKTRWENLPLDDKKRFAHLCPDFVIELLSESDSLQTAKNKMQEWIDNGCQLGWLIDLEQQKIFIYQHNKEITTLDGFDRTVSGGNVLSGFELNMEELKTS
ncbi:MAG: Uma2 family endonuclease [Bacteroidota bacterium]